MAQAIMTEDSALRSEVLQRITTQVAATRASLVLTGGFVGLVLPQRIFGLDASILLAIVTGARTESLDVLFVLFCGYVLGLELIASHAIYQLYMMFCISNYLTTLGARLKQVVQSPDNIPFFEWEEPRSFADASRLPNTKHPKGVKFALRVGALLQPLSFHGLILAGLTALLFILRTVWAKQLYPGVQLAFTLTLVCLAGGWLLLLAVHWGLRKWQIGQSGLVHHGLASKAEDEHNDEDEVDKGAR